MFDIGCQTTDTGFSQLYECLITVLSDGSVVASGAENKLYKLKRFSMEMGRELGSARLTEAPCGMTEVQLGGRATMAMRYA